MFNNITGREYDHFGNKRGTRDSTGSLLKLLIWPFRLSGIRNEVGLHSACMLFAAAGLSVLLVFEVLIVALVGALSRM